MAKTPSVIKRKCFLASYLILTLETHPLSPPTPVSGTGSAGAKMASDESPPLLVSSATSDDRHNSNLPVLEDLKFFILKML